MSNEVVCPRCRGWGFIFVLTGRGYYGGTINLIPVSLGQESVEAPCDACDGLRRLPPERARVIRRERWLAFLPRFFRRLGWVNLVCYLFAFPFLYSLDRFAVTWTWFAVLILIFLASAVTGIRNRMRSPLRREGRTPIGRPEGFRMF